MIPTTFPNQNRVLTAPADMPDVKPLPVYTDGESVISCWKLSWRERLRVLFLGVVWVWILTSAETQPPMTVTTKVEFEPDA